MTQPQSFIYSSFPLHCYTIWSNGIDKFTFQAYAVEDVTTHQDYELSCKGAAKTKLNVYVSWQVTTLTQSLVVDLEVESKMSWARQLLDSCSAIS